VTPDRVIFGTSGFLGSGAELRCVDLQDDKNLIWSAPLNGGVWSPPVVREQRVYAGSSDGLAHCLDLLSGKSAQQWPVSLDKKGRVWLALVDNNLYVVSESGRVYALDSRNASQAWTGPAILDDELKAGPAVAQKKLYVGSTSGKLHAIDMRGQSSELIAHGFQSIVAAPVYQDEILYFGAMDHELRAFNTKTGQIVWHFSCEHAIATSPTIANGLIFVSGNNGHVYALDAQNGTLGWEYQFQNTKIMSSPAFFEDLIYLGSDTGEVVALPWHLGKYDWAADHLAKQHKFADAARFFAITSALETIDLKRKEAYYEQAIQHWQKEGDRVHAAAFRRSLPGQSPSALAHDYEDAGKLQGNASLFRRAAELYEQANDLENATRCTRAASSLSHAPYLSVIMVSDLRNWEAEQEREVYFDIKNHGDSTAENITIRLAGNLVMRMRASLKGSLPPGKAAEMSAFIIPAGPGELVIEPTCTDARGAIWPEIHRFPFENVRPSTVMVDVTGDAGVVDLRGIPLDRKIRIRGDVGIISIGAVTAEVQTCPNCRKIVKEANSTHCQECGASLTS
jgi:outer membrane protein assembly factor BamB